MVLQKNLNAEELEEGQALLWTYSKAPKSERPEEQGKLLKYNVHRVLGWEGFLSTHGTFLADASIWRTCAVYWVLTVALAAYELHLHLKKSSYAMQESHLDALTLIAGYSTTLLGFMLSLFVSNIIKRWWTMRDKAIGGLWTASTDATHYLAIRFTNPEDQPFLETIVRYCLLSHRLLYMEAGESLVRRTGRSRLDLVGSLSTHDVVEGGSETWDNLVAVGLVTAAERRALEGRPRTAQLVWVWVNRLARDALVRGIEQKKIAGGVCGQTRSFDAIVIKARAAIEEVFVYTTTQLPFQYVHLLAFTVMVSNVLLSIKCGTAIGRELAPNTGRGTEYLSSLVQVFQVFFVPFSYHAFLRLCDDLSNPFGDTITGNNFPEFAYHCALRAECLSIIRLGAEPPELEAP
jgi:hypothetical protein